MLSKREPRPYKTGKTRSTPYPTPKSNADRIERLETNQAHYQDWLTYRAMVQAAFEDGDWDLIQRAETFAERKKL